MGLFGKFAGGEFLHFFEVYGPIAELIPQTSQCDAISLDASKAVLFRFVIHVHADVDLSVHA